MGSTAPSERRTRVPWQIFSPLLAAASIAISGWIGLPLLRAAMEPPDRTLATNAGGRATLKFTDGTEIDLNTSTAVRYRMTNEQRIVWLDSGEAYFRVAHNAANPFTVIAVGHHITDLGTEFLVRDETNAVDVVLVRGKAQFASESPSAPSTTLQPGYEAFATSGSMSVTLRTQQQVADELAWQRGVIVFRNTRLADAVQEFNRYNDIKLVIVDPSIARVRFSAEARTNDYDGFLHVAQSLLKLRVNRVGNEILISGAQVSKKAARTKRGD